MISAILAIIFILLLFLSVSLRRVFHHQSARELKKRARRGDTGANQLYKLAAHGNNLLLFLWVLIVVSAAFACVFLSRLLPFWIALASILLIIWLSFVWFPHSRVSRLEIIITGWLAKPTAWLLNFLYKPLTGLDSLIARLGLGVDPGELYSREDLLKFIITQKNRPDSQIDPIVLEITIRALGFEDKKIADIMTPRRSLSLVSAKDKVSPILIDDLHKSGASRFLVYQDKQDNVVGTLKLNQLTDLKKTGRISNYMDQKVYYLHEDYSLRRVLDAFYKTQQHLFAVVNKFEDLVGTITVEDVLAEIISPVTEEFDDYQDLSAVAKNQAEAKHIAREAAGSETGTES